MANLPIALLLPGQGAQHPGMAVQLYEREPEFSALLDEFFSLLGSEGTRLREDWLSDAPTVSLDDGTRAQPLLFIIDYAIATVLRNRGVKPAVLLGHSVGELAAAALARVFDLAAAARILAARSKVLTKAPVGGLLGVATTPEIVESHLDHSWFASGVVIGAINAPRQTVLSGPETELTVVERALREAGLTTRRVPARQPFHSPVLNTVLEPFEQAIAAETLRPPAVPIRSARTASIVTPREAIDPTFWARQLAEPVLFWPALSGLLADDDFTLVETGPGGALAASARRHPAVRAGGSEALSLLSDEPMRAWRCWSEGLTRLGLPASARAG